MTRKHEYDAIIIGAGIGGLVCGCYLAKAGMKTLIVEKNIKVGGLCTSFRRGGVSFDACVHLIGSCGEGGVVTTILNDLEITREINFSRMSPQRIIVSEDKNIEIDITVENTIENLCRQFPEERKNLKVFFNIIMNEEYIKLAAKLKKLSFEQFFKSYVVNEELNNLFSFLFFMTTGLSNDLLSGLFGVILLKEFIIDGGYYLKDGIQKFPDKLCDTFKKHGGTVLLNSEVKEIILNENQRAIKITSGEEISTNTIISNIDAVHTLKNLLKTKEAEDALKPLLTMEPSLSGFILYLKLNKDPMYSSYVHYISLRKNVRRHLYDNAVKSDFSNNYLDCFFSKSDGSYKAVISHMASFNNKDFWIKNKQYLTDKILKEFMNKTDFNAGDIELMETVTPISLYNWSYSYNGANFGWAPLVSQVFPNFKFQPKIPNLYFVGHWLGRGNGISSVASLGKYVANTILGYKD